MNPTRTATIFPYTTLFRSVVPTAAYKCDKDLFELRSEGGYEYPEGTNNDWNVFGGL